MFPWNHQGQHCRLPFSLAPLQVGPCLWSLIRHCSQLEVKQLITPREWDLRHFVSKFQQLIDSIKIPLLRDSNFLLQFQDLLKMSVSLI